MKDEIFDVKRVVCWFSAGVTSAVAAHLAKKNEVKSPLHTATQARNIQTTYVLLQTVRVGWAKK